MSPISLGIYGGARYVAPPVQLLHFRSASFEPQPTTFPEVYPVSLGPEHPNRQVILMVTWVSAGNDNLAVPTIDGMPFNVIDIGAGWSQNSGYGGSGVYRLDYPTGDNVSILIEGSSNSRMHTAIGVWVTYEDLAVHTLFSGNPTTLPASIYLPAGVPYIYGIGVNQNDSPVVSGADITHIASTVFEQKSRTIVEGVSTGTVALSVSGVGTPSQAKQSFVAYAQVPNIAPGTPVFDSFNRPNATWGLGFADSGHAWKQWDTGIVGIDSGRAYRASSNSFAVVDFGQPDMHVSQRVSVSGSFFGGPVAGAADSQNWYRISTESTGLTCKIRRSIAGVEGQPPGVGLYSFVAGDILGLEVEQDTGGTWVRLYINGEMKNEVFDTDPNRPMGTHGGMRPYNSSGIRIDNFSISRVDKTFFVEDFGFGTTSSATPPNWQPIDTGVPINWQIATTSSRTRLRQGENNDSSAIRPILMTVPVMKTANHYAECTLDGYNTLGYGPGPAVRLSGTSLSDLRCYYFNARNGTLNKIVDGVVTLLDSIPGHSASSLTTTYRIEVSGSMVKAFVNGVQALSIEDSEITSGNTGFIAGRDGGFDNWRTGDI